VPSRVSPYKYHYP